MAKAKASEGGIDTSPDLKKLGADGVSPSDATTYASLTDLSDYIIQYNVAENSAWNDELRKGALRQASWIINGIGGQRYRWKGSRASYEQAFAWPRSGADVGGVTIPDTYIPPQLALATCAMAVYVLIDPTRVDKIVDHNRVVNMRRIGPLEQRFAVGEGSRVGVSDRREKYNFVEDILSGLLYERETEEFAEGDTNIVLDLSFY